MSVDSASSKVIIDIGTTVRARRRIRAACTGCRIWRRCERVTTMNNCAITRIAASAFCGACIVTSRVDIGCICALITCTSEQIILQAKALPPLVDGLKTRVSSTAIMAVTVVMTTDHPSHHTKKTTTTGTTRSDLAQNTIISLNVVITTIESKYT